MDIMSSIDAPIEPKVLTPPESSPSTISDDPKLDKLREWMSSAKLDAFIVPTDDPHLSEYVAPCFNRREFISGFTGSAGTAVITEKEALLWTDGRYYLQAEEELGSSWILMKAGQPKVPTLSSWLSSNIMKDGSVGLDPFVHSAKFYNDLSEKLAKSKIRLCPLCSKSPNPIDVIWGDARPAFPTGPLRVHPIEFAGETMPSKLEKVRAELEKSDAHSIVICALDEVAYLFNIRGSDVDYNPVALAYAVISMDSAHLFFDKSRIPDNVLVHLHGVNIHPYSTIISFLGHLAFAGKIVWVDQLRVNSAIWQAIPDAQRITESSPIPLAKAIKNEAELMGMRSCHVRDSAALSEFLCWLEKAIQGGRVINEIEADIFLSEYRALREGYFYPSFPTIACSGPNGAIIHYHAKPESCRNLDVNSMFLLDSGGQYIDGTTDVTRTVHFGTPTLEEITAFTLVLKGHIGIDTSTFPDGTPGYALDAFARRALWDAGLDYTHGTGHGVGAALNVHEGPHSISPRPGNATPLKPGMIVSNEPGYYLPDKFGIRIENLVEIISTGVRNESLERDFYGFQPLTLVPIQKSLIDINLMTTKELDWLDKYHSVVWEKISSFVNEDTREWLSQATEKINR